MTHSPRAGFIVWWLSMLLLLSSASARAEGADAALEKLLEPLGPRAASVRQAVKELEDRRYQVREAASRRLTKLGPEGLGLLRHVRDTTASAEVRGRTSRAIREILIRLNRPVTVLGMKLVSVDDQWRKRLGLRYTSEKARERFGEITGALVLDPGKNHARFGIGPLRRGNSFWIVGPQRMGGTPRVKGVETFVRGLLDACSTAGGRWPVRVRVVYHVRFAKGWGTRTRHMQLTRADARDLRKTLAQLYR